MNAPKPLLVLPCSGPKRPGQLPAIEKYTGKGIWGLLRARQDWAAIQERINILIVSAQYGLLLPNDIVDDYEQPMTASRQASLSASAKHTRTTRQTLERLNPKEIYIALPKAYRAVFETWIEPLNASVTIHTYSKGAGIGSQRGELTRWLNNF